VENFEICVDESLDWGVIMESEDNIKLLAEVIFNYYSPLI